MISYIFTTSMLGLIFAFSILYLVRRNVLSVSYALWWIVIALFIFAGGIFPHALDVLGFALGVSYPPILFVVLALLVLAFRMLFADIHRTRLEEQLRDLVQNHALLTGKVAQLERLVEQSVDRNAKESSSMPDTKVQ